MIKRKLSFDYEAYAEFIAWEHEDKKVFKKINQLLKEIYRTPFEGSGKPEPLKYKLQGAWSRRITKEHRLVYVVEKSDILVLSCKSHYK